ncbi:MAG: GTPase [Candidatus Aramenus sulfurataquae]|jgi:GTPase SAR1 family protein|uniref:ATP/GTP-binding protein n=2 Tax=Candidatus Aramenus sulfurataquae TaxID=1326980 RepID=W7L673_9CREN|nr:MAG: GTPase [Candidatus Aramenus sulfurataquae]MCL7343979.1 ATP/GTP-binding protein [Candidatus Aramenus sulfurataquae]
MYFIFFTGTAGAGKTTIVKEFRDYLIDQEMDVATINLDPAVENLPYTPDFDVRDYVDAFEVMQRYQLGPNTSLIVSIDLVLSKAGEIKKEIDEIEANYVLVDTPGQVELFAYRDTGRLISSLIAGENRAVNVFLMDSFLAKEARSYVSLLLLSSAIKFRLNLPQVNVLSKADLLSEKELENIKSWGEGEKIVDDLGTIDEYSFELVKTIVENLDSPPIPVSSVTDFGFDELYAEVQKVLAGGEDYLTEENNPRI